MHGYFFKKLQNDESIDKSVSNSRSTYSTITSHFEGYINAIQDQEIPTKYLVNKRQKDANLQPTCNNKCRLCKVNTDVNHIISRCPQMSVRYYLPLRHDLVAKSLLKSLILKQNPLDKYKHQKESEYVYNVGNVEYWLNFSIQATTKLSHNKPDIIIWNREQKTCNILILI